jgi:glycosyltransferase involved in cell wall biosynthesis
MPASVLFITIDGLTDPLGQSQVLPYMAGLAKKGFSISIVSCEKEENFRKNAEAVTKITTEHKITWKYCFYESRVPVISQRKNLKKLGRLAVSQFLSTGKRTIVHCRSYLPALVGLHLKNKYKAKIIFDMRGFWADERIEGSIWKLSNPLHRFMYRFFKRKEKELVHDADYIVTLSDKAKKIIAGWMPGKKLSCKVIPCCADMEHFTIKTSNEKDTRRKELNIPQNAFVVGYLGSIGTWYMLNEMLDFFIELQKKKSNAIFFFVTPDDNTAIIKSAWEKNIPLSAIITRSASRSEVPFYISTFDTSLFFIRPTFSKKGSSPTKMAELLACGIPVIINPGIGDCDTMITENKCGITVESFTADNYIKAINSMDESLSRPKEYYRNVALANFSLEKGIEAYSEIYSELAAAR